MQMVLTVPMTLLLTHACKEARLAFVTVHFPSRHKCSTDNVAVTIYLGYFP